jgi:hypothetical protein
LDHFFVDVVANIWIEGASRVEPRVRSTSWRWNTLLRRSRNLRPTHQLVFRRFAREQLRNVRFKSFKRFAVAEKLVTLMSKSCNSALASTVCVRRKSR